MSMQFRANPFQLADLKRIAGIGSTRLEQIRAVLAERTIPTLSPQALLDSIRGIVDDPAADALIRQLLSIHGIVRQTGRQINEVVAGIRLAVEQQGAAVELEVADWQVVEPVVSELVALQSIRLASKALELAYDYQSLLRRTKILTDIRPIYDETGNAIEGAVVSYTLHVHYDSAEGEHEISIALDESDVLALRDQCIRAVTKAATAKKLIAESCGIAATISGESSDA